MASSFTSVLGGGNITHVPGDRKEAIVTLTIGASDTYATGGIAVTPANLGLASIDYMGDVTFSTGHWGVYVPGTGKIKVFSAAATELVNASTALQNATAVIQAIGK